jgi:regulator of RNase E activity RraA
VLSAKPYARPAELNGSLTVTAGGRLDPPVVVHAGDVIVCDMDGVVCVPRARLSEVAQLCVAIEETEDRIRRDLLEGVSIAEAFKRHR